MALRFDASSSTLLHRFIPSPSLLRPSGTSRVSSRYGRWISRSYCSVVRLDSQENTTRPCIDTALDSVVKIFSVSSTPDLIQPWQRDAQKRFTGSGFVVSGQKILTNARVVEHHSYVQVRKHGSTTKYKAKVEVVGQECDLAILSIDSQEFWEALNPLQLGDIPSLKETVFVLGYPEGGDSISVTKGVVSRVGTRQSKHSSTTRLLAIQTDAAINKGNSGGPVIMGNKVAGVACMGDVIATPVIKQFLDGVEESNQYSGVGSLEISCQPLVNPGLREYFKMSRGMTGALVNETYPLSNADGVLKKDDIILAIDGVPIANDETVIFRRKESIYFSHLVSMKKPGQTALLDVLREGQKHEFSIVLKPVKPLIPERPLDASYYIFAGFVFVPLSMSYIKATDMCDQCLPKRKAQKPGEQIVMITEVIQNDVTTGYTDYINLQVKKVNGVEVVNLKHLCQLIEKCCSEFLRLDLEDERVVAMKYEHAKEATSSTLERFGMLCAMSKDLRDENEQKA